MLAKFLVFFPIVQTPAPAYGIEIGGNLTNCALVRFEINTNASESSYITHLIVYLNNLNIKNISARQVKKLFFIHELKPFTEYNLGIKTQDGSLQTSVRVTKMFKTKKAG